MLRIKSQVLSAECFVAQAMRFARNRLQRGSHGRTGRNNFVATKLFMCKTGALSAVCFYVTYSSTVVWVSIFWRLSNRCFLFVEDIFLSTCCRASIIGETCPIYSNGKALDIYMLRAPCALNALWPSAMPHFRNYTYLFFVFVFRLGMFLVEVICVL